MPSWCTLYKGLFTLVVLLIAIEYFFGTIIETRKWESPFFNNTRFKGEIHSPLINSLVAATKKSSNHTEEHSTKVSTSSTTVSYNNTKPNVTVAVSSLFDVGVFTDYASEPHNRGSYNSSESPLCPDNPPGLDGPLTVIKSDPATTTELEARFSWLMPGGHGTPENCRVLEKVALIIPYRCRAEHLLLFLQHMHPFLRKQQVDYTLYIIEQSAPTAFNRAALMNVGYREALKIANYDCFIFHDIDLLPEDDRNLYTCPEQPRHMSAAVDRFSYRLPYKTIFGGVSAITREHFMRLNGFSNSFWGWGGEDDDMANRITYHNLHISRYPLSIARYTMLMHKKEKANPNRYNTLKAGRHKYDSDGLSNLKYTVKELKKKMLYTWLLVELGPHS